MSECRPYSKLGTSCIEHGRSVWECLAELDATTRLELQELRLYPEKLEAAESRAREAERLLDGIREVDLAEEYAAREKAEAALRNMAEEIRMVAHSDCSPDVSFDECQERRCVYARTEVLAAARERKGKRER